MRLADMLAEDQRLVLLRLLTEVPSGAANETVLKAGLAHFGHRIGSDVVRAHIAFLERGGLVRREELQAQSGQLWLVTLTAAGEDVADGRTDHPGVARRGAE